jgi:ADP-ribose pyrophosphatase YjhB (NUDIX family)
VSFGDRLASGASELWAVLPAALRKRVMHAANPKFLVGVVGLVKDDDGRVLLLEHRFRPPYPWGLPGGFIDRGETFEQALIRELREELGLEVTIEPGIFDVELNLLGDYVTITMVAHTAEKTPPPPRSREIVKGAFFGPGALPEGTYPHHAALVRALHEKSGRT